MKNKELWKAIIQIAVSILTAVLIKEDTFPVLSGICLDSA